MKAALIIDMPDNCIDCPISTCYSCHVHGLQPHPRKGKPDWCPLRPLPEKQSNHTLSTAGLMAAAKHADD